MNIAKTFYQRLMGARAQPLPLFIPNCKAVHTFGLKESIDVYWVDEEDEIIRADFNLKPNRIRFCFMASGVVEKKVKGQALVESALILPWIFLLLWGFFQLGVLLVHQLQLTNATNQAAQVLAQTNNESLAEDLFYRLVNPSNEKDFLITSENISGNSISNNIRNTGDVGQINATWQHEPPLRILEDLWEITAESSSVIVCNHPLGNLPCR